MMTMQEVRTEEYRIKSLTVVLDHAYRGLKEADRAYKEEQAKPHSIMIDWALAHFRECQSYYDGICNAIFAAGYAICSDVNGNIHIEVI